MRLTLVLVLLSVILSTPVLADRKTPPMPPQGVNAGEGIPRLKTARDVLPRLLDFQGTPVNVRLMAADGFNFNCEPVDVCRPLMYGFLETNNAIPDRYTPETPVISQWTFVCTNPRETYGGIELGNWRRSGGANFTNEKYTVRATVCFYENVRFEKTDEVEDYQTGRLVAGPFTGVGKANAITGWNVFYQSWGWAFNGLNLQFGQREWGDDKLQLKALCESVKNLKPMSYASPLR